MNGVPIRSPCQLPGCKYSPYGPFHVINATSPNSELQRDTRGQRVWNLFLPREGNDLRSQTMVAHSKIIKKRCIVHVYYLCV